MGLQATSDHWDEFNGTVFLVSSDIFTFSGLQNSAEGVPALRSWAITNTSRITLVCQICLQTCLQACLVGPAWCQATPHTAAGTY